MTNPSPSAAALSQPVELIEAERFCPGCSDCWPVTPEFWNKSSIRNDGLQRLCRACQLESGKGEICQLFPDAQSKACGGCKQHKPLTNHYWHCSPDKKDGFATKCKVCAKKVRDARRASPKAVAPVTPFRAKAATTYKLCTCCQQTKPLVRRFWHRNASREDGYHSHCKDCVNTRNAFARHLPVHERPKKAPVKRKLNEFAVSKSCNSCHQDKPLTTEFWYTSKATSDGYMRVCKLCNSAAQKARLQKRRELKQQSLATVDADRGAGADNLM
jgi:hypothetical protein